MRGPCSAVLGKLAERGVCKGARAFFISLQVGGARASAEADTCTPPSLATLSTLTHATATVCATVIGETRRGCLPSDRAPFFHTWPSDHTIHPRASTQEERRVRLPSIHTHTR